MGHPSFLTARAMLLTTILTAILAQLRSYCSGQVPIQQAYLKASNTDLGDHFGWSIAVSGDTLVVGAPFEDGGSTGANGNQGNPQGFVDSGAVYVFVRNGSTWTQEAYLKASNTDAGDQFGLSVAISGDTIVVGAPGEDSSATGVNGSQNNSSSNVGAAYVFTRSGAIWTQEAYLKASNAGGADLFGIRVALADNTVVIGAYGEDSSSQGVNGNQLDNSADGAGAAYVFFRTGAVWTQQAYLKASNAQGSDAFGGWVAINGDTAVVSASLEASSAVGVNGPQSNNGMVAAGAVYVFNRTGGIWSQQAYLKSLNTQPHGEFGIPVVIDGDTIAAGARGESGNAGSVYTFVRTGTSWSPEAHLVSSNQDPGDRFGNSIAILGNSIVIGADREAGLSTGVVGNRGDNSGFQVGAAYLFSRSLGLWSQQAYLKASNAESNDQFGFHAAIMGNLVIISSSGEASNAALVNGNQGNNLAPGAGAAYVFDLAPSCMIDQDADGVPDCQDNCFNLTNPAQDDCDMDGIGDVCELAAGTQLDLNGSGVPDECDPCGTVTTYCTSGTTVSGCQAAMAGFGTPSASMNSGFTLTASNVEGLRQGLLFYGITGRSAAPWASGSSSFICVGSPTQRMGFSNSGGTAGVCDGVLSVDWNAYISSHPAALGQPILASQTIDAQAWFRDPGAPGTTNLSNGLEFTVCP